MADVLNRTTKILLKSVHTPDYPAASWIINPDLSAVAGIPSEEWVIEGDSVRAMTTAEKDTQLLETIKSRKFAAINNRTRELIAKGFEHPAASGQFFSLFADAQRNINDLEVARSLPELSFPVKWNTLDDFGVLSMSNSAVVHDFYLDALLTYRGHLDSGTALKDQVRAATTAAAVNAVTDDR